MSRSPKVKQPHCLSVFKKNLQNIQDSYPEHPGGFWVITCWSNSQRNKFSSSTSLVTRRMWESNKNSSLYFIKINKMILTKASVVFGWGRALKSFSLSFPKPWSLLLILTLNNQLTCPQHVSFSKKVINQLGNQLPSFKKREREIWTCWKQVILKTYAKEWSAAALTYHTYTAVFCYKLYNL